MSGQQEATMWPCVAVPPKDAKIVKNELQAEGVIEKNVQICEKVGGVVLFPVVKGREDEVKGRGEMREVMVKIIVKKPQVAVQKVDTVVAEVDEKIHAGDTYFGTGNIEEVVLDDDMEGSVKKMRQIVAKGVPVLIRNLPLGDCMKKWSVEYLTKIPKEVAAQVCESSKVDLAGHREKNTKGNFSFVKMAFSELVSRCDKPDDHEPIKHKGERYYLRTVGEGRISGPTHLPDVMPELAADVDFEKVKEMMKDGGGCDYHSSALRVTAPDTELWAHYDILPNLLTQILGEKTVTLLPPSADPYLYVSGTSSRVDSPTHPDLYKYPLAAAIAATTLTTPLPTGTTLYIPPLWFHHTHSRSNGVSVAINTFYEQGVVKKWYQAKDFYGNKDFPAGGKVLEKVMKAVKEVHDMPQPYKAFYLRRVATAVEDVAGCVEGVYKGEKDVAVVTGGTGVIGKEVVKGLVGRGYYVVVVSRRVEAEVEGGVVRVCDLSDGEGTWRCVEGVRREFGEKITLLVNNAAVVTGKTQVVTSTGSDVQFEVNSASYYRFIKGLLPCPHLQNIVNVGSNWSGGFDPADVNFKRRKYSSSAAYRASKQATRILTHALAPHIVPTVNCCHPGVVAPTPLSTSLGLTSGTHTPSQAAESILHLCSHDLKYTGKYLPDGPESTPVEDTQWVEHEAALLELLEWS